METYTAQQFADKHGLTVVQVKTNAYRDHFDSKVEVLRTKEYGGKRRQVIILESEKTLEWVAKIKTLKLSGTRAKQYVEKDTLILKNGLEVRNDILGKVMMGGDDSIRYERQQ